MKIAVIGSGIVGKLVSLRLSDLGFEVTNIFRKEKAFCASYAAHGVMTVKGNIKARDPVFSLQCKATEGFSDFLLEIERRSLRKISRINGVFESDACDTEYSRIKNRVYKNSFSGLFRYKYFTQEDVLNKSMSLLTKPFDKTGSVGWFFYPKDIWVDTLGLLEALNIILKKKVFLLRKK